MSVHSNDNSILKACGTLTHFEFGFKVFKDEDLIVSLMDPETQDLTPLKLNVDYTVSISRIRDGGSIELNETHNGYSLYAYREIEIIQPHEVPTEGYFPESTIENALDRGIMIDQQLQEQINRCIAIPGTSGFSGVNVQLPVPKAGNTLAWSEAETHLENFDVKGTNDEFKADVNTTLANARSELTTQITNFSNEITSEINELESSTNAQITDFKDEVNTKIQQVSDAAAKINQLEDAVNTAVTSANIATEKADMATETVQNSLTNIESKTLEGINKIKQTGFYMEGDKLYYIDSNGETKEFKSTGSSAKIGDIGFAPYVDETTNERRRLNGQVLIKDQYPAFVTWLTGLQATTPSLFATEDEWQSIKTASDFGVVNKFVIGDTTVRLPNYPDYIIAGADKSGIITNQEKIAGYYYITVNTGSETTKPTLNDYTVTTAYQYGMSQYYKGIMNSGAWLRSNGQWNPKAIYEGLYNWALAQLNAGVEGFKSSTASDITDYDFVINQTNESFRLPLKNGMEGVFASGIVPSDYNLYYYCGNVEEKPQLVNVARIEEALVNKLDTPPRYVVEVSDKSLLPSWYEIYNDGWCRQGGDYNGSATTGTITLLKEYKDVESYSIMTQVHFDNSGYGYQIGVFNKSINRFKWGSAGSNYKFNWQASGYIR